MDVSRRDLLKGGAVLATGALASAGVFALGSCTSAQENVSDASSAPSWDLETDVVVVGAGGAGLAAAAKAAEGGAKTIVLEKLDAVGGDTLLSGGLLVCGGSSLHKEAGIDLSAEQYWAQIEKTPGVIERARPALYKEVTMKGPDAIEWLLDLGVDVKPPSATSPSYCVVLPPYSLSGLIDPMEAEVTALGVEIMTNTTMKQLLQDAEGAVVGVEAENSSGETIHIKATATILATGHYTFNDEMVNKYDRASYAAEHYVPLPANSSQGEGILAAKAVGAALDGMSLGCTLKFQEPVISLLVLSQPVMMVDESGKRFFNEDGGYGAGGPEMLQQEIPVSFYIFDEKAGQGTYQESIAEGVEKGWIQKGDTIEELANAAGIDAAGLAAQLAKYNEDAAAGFDTEFRRESEQFVPLDQPPYYAWKCLVCRYKTDGGIMADEQGRALSQKDETPIPGLFVVGATCGSSTSNTLQCITTGLIAGEAAAATIS